MRRCNGDLMARVHVPGSGEPISLVVARVRTRYRVKMSAGKRADGHRKQLVRTFDTLGEARRMVNQVRADLAEGRYRARDDMTLNDLCARWLSQKDDVRPITL